MYFYGWFYEIPSRFVLHPNENNQTFKSSNQSWTNKKNGRFNVKTARAQEDLSTVMH